MPRRRPSSASHGTDAPSPQPGDGPTPPSGGPGVAPPGMPSLADLGIAGVSRRRVAWIGLTALAAWIVFGFVGQAAEASRAATRVADAQALTAEASEQTAALRRELQLVTEERWILQQARAYQLGSRKERPFALAPNAPELPADAPGSALRRIGAEVVERSPLESWLEVLFGPGG